MRKGSFLPFFLLLLFLLALFRGGRRPPAPDPVRTPPIYLDLNRASAFQLSLLPGLGPARSARIVEERRKGGAFLSLDDLARRVAGLGPGLVGRFAPFLKNLPPPGTAGR